jgi:hypothetical protein
MRSSHNGNVSNPISVVRWTLARARSREYGTSERERASQFRRGLNAALLKVRSDLTENEYASFIAKAEALSSTERLRFGRQPIGYDYLTLLFEPKAIPLEEEILWVASRLSAEKKLLNDFAARANSVVTLLFKGGSGAALEELDKIDGKVGASLWSHELRIALIQRAHGESAKKEYVKRIRSTFKKGMLPILTIYFSQREEPNVTIAWFLDNVRRRIERMYNVAFREYALYKTTKELPRDMKSLATILRIEQNHHLIDVYETFVHILQHLVGERNSPAMKGVLTKAINLLSGINDFRIERIKQKLDTSFFRYKSDGLASDSLEATLSGDPKSGLIKAKQALKATPHSLPALLSACVARGCGTRSSLPRLRAKSSTASFVIDGLNHVLLRKRESDTQNSKRSDTIAKFSHSFDGLPVVRAIHQFIRSQRANSPIEMFRLGELIILNSDFSLPSGRCFSEFLDLIRGGVSPQPTSLSMLSSSYALASSFLLRNEPGLAAECIKPALQSSSRLIASSASVVALEAYAESGEVGFASHLVSAECIKHDVDSMRLPITDTFKDVPWATLKPFANDITLSNSLFLYSQLIDDDKVLTYRSFALNKVLESLGVDRPSKLAQYVDRFDIDEFGFFLGRACSASVIDMLPAIGGTSIVMQERRSICAILMNLNLDPNDEYQQELVSLTRELAIQSGMQIFDGSRVHVDIDELRNSLKRDFAESFQRYLAISKTDPSGNENFDAVLRGIARGDESSKHLLSIPKEEADDLLLFMLIGARQRFLYDVPHGLDSYLSKRVRHGSVVGVIRAPAEKEFMITQRDDESKSYVSNKHWFANVDQNTRHQLDLAFASFAKTFDDHLIRLKDVILHVKSEAHPLGIFDVPIQGPVYHLIKSVALRDRSIDSFVTTLMSSMWGLLNPSLQRAKQILEQDTFKVLTDAFQTLRKKIYAIVPECSDRNSFNSALGLASSNVQSAVKTVASWFEPVVPEDCWYSIEDMIDVAKASVHAINNSFQPDIKLTAPNSLDIAATTLPVLIDIMFVAFGNASKWSDIPGRVPIRVWVTHDEEKGLLRIRVENDVATSCLTATSKQKVEEKKREVIGGAFDGARSEGGSGLIKVASIISQSSSGKIDFGFLDPASFFIEADLAFVTPRGSTDENSGR